MSHEAHLCVHRIPLMNVGLIHKCIKEMEIRSITIPVCLGIALGQVPEGKDVWHRSLPGKCTISREDVCS